MPTWGNTDIHNQKPKFDVERETRESVQLALFVNKSVYTGTTNTTIQLAYNDGAGNNVANIGVAADQYVYIAGTGSTTTSVSANGYAGFFEGTNQVASISGNTVTLTSGVTSNIAVGTIIEFDNAIAYNANKTQEASYGKDTVLVTPTRLANNQVTMGNINPGWVHIQKKTNNDGTVRYIHETLVALANPVAANVYSGNTSWGTAFTGV